MVHLTHPAVVSVDFQDYNLEVLEHVTEPNVKLNIQSDCKCHARFISGPWSEVERHFKTDSMPKYDVVLSAETLYSVESMPAL